MKLGVMKDQLPGSLAGADGVYCYTRGLSWDARATLSPLGTKVRCVDDLEELVVALSTEARTGDHVLVMSNGGFGAIHARLLEKLAARNGSC